MAVDRFTDCTVQEVASRTRNALVGGPFGSDLVSKDYVPSGVPVIRGTNMGHGRWVEGEFAFVTPAKADSLSANCAKPGDLVFTQRGTLGQVALVPANGFDLYLISQSQMKLTVDETKADALFLYYLFTSVEQQEYIRQNAIQTGVPHTNLGILRNTPLSLPPLPEQKAIAAVLGALDDKIELNRRMNATLEAMARALFQSWFVDFDPVRAKAESRPPAGLDEATAALFPDKFQNSELGPIPEGWEICPLAERIELLSGGTPKTSEPDYWDGDIPWYSVKDAPAEGDVWVIQTEKRITKLGIANSAAKILPEGTTIISARGTVGKLALVGTPMAMNQSCYGVRSVKNYADYFTYFALLQATAELQQRTHGTVFDTITRQTFETLDCVFPPAVLTQSFDKTVAPLLGQLRANIHQSRTLTTLRDTLLPKLLSGELSVPLPGSAGKIIPFPMEPAVVSEKKTPPEFIEAVVIASLVRKVSSVEHPLGRKRYNKLAYLAHRKAEDDVTLRYLKKAAGPYSPWAKYGGPEKIAEKNGYVVRSKTGVYEGLIVGPNIGKIDAYLSHYPVAGAVDWVVENFRYERNDELELLATVDFAALDLIREGQPVACAEIEQVIATNKDWAPKLKRTIFSPSNIERALERLASLFPATYPAR